MRTLVWMLLVLGARPAAALQLDLRADLPATAYWTLNALAGDPHTESARWRETWRTQGPAQDDDAAMAQRFARVRERYRGPFLHVPTRPNPFVPVSPPPETRLEVRFAAVFLASATMAEVWSRAELLMAEADVRELQTVFAWFEPRMQAFHRKQTHLATMPGRFRDWAKTQDLDGFLGKVEHFYGCAGMPPLRVHVVPAPVGEVLHGRRLGRDLVVETRERDSPYDRAHVVVHEAAHACAEMAGLNDDPLVIEGLFHAGDATADRAWELLDEALATAVAQGGWQARVDPAAFARTLTTPRTWYVDDAIEGFAKSLWPAVGDALQTGKTLQDMAPALLPAWQRVRPPQTPKLLLRHAVRIARNLSVLEAMGFAEWIGRVDEAAGLMARWRSASFVVAVMPADVGILAEVLPPEPRPRRGIWVQHRPGGGCLFVLVGADEAELSRLAAVLLAAPMPADGWTPTP